MPSALCTAPSASTAQCSTDSDCYIVESAENTANAKSAKSAEARAEERRGSFSSSDEREPPTPTFKRARREQTPDAEATGRKRKRRRRGVWGGGAKDAEWEEKYEEVEFLREYALSLAYQLHVQMEAITKKWHAEDSDDETTESLGAYYKQDRLLEQMDYDMHECLLFADNASTYGYTLPSCFSPTYKIYNGEDVNTTECLHGEPDGHRDSAASASASASASDDEEEIPNACPMTSPASDSDE